MNEHHTPMEIPPGAPLEQQALQVLTMAQRTAEEHLGDAQREADRIRGEAQERAAYLLREAQAHAESAHHEAERVTAEAQAAAARIAEEAWAQAGAAQRDAESIVADAQRKADDIARIARSEADELEQLAEQRYEDVTGSLAARRAGLQQQIEALERFDREYRGRLQAFMQGQMRALWHDDPQVDPEALGRPEAGPVIGSAPVPRDGAEHPVEHRARDS